MYKWRFNNKLDTISQTLIEFGARTTPSHEWYAQGSAFGSNLAHPTNGPTSRSTQRDAAIDLQAGRIVITLLR